MNLKIESAFNVEQKSIRFKNFKIITKSVKNQLLAAFVAPAQS
jgi:hypothetical protein